MRNYFRIGKIISIHGIRGEIKVFPTTDDVRRFDDLKKFYIIDSEDAEDIDFGGKNTYESEGTKYIKNTCILKIKGYDSIEDSTKLIGKNIYVDRDNAINLNKNEYFVMDLIGLMVTKDDTLYGKVNDIMKTKANDILVIEHEGKEILVPLVEDFIENVDISASTIKIKNIEGLI